MDQKFTLQSNYIRVKRQDSGELTFGGDQNFFASSVKGQKFPETCSFKKLPEDEKKRRMGCGIVALSDIFLYLSGKHKTERSIAGASYVNQSADQEKNRDDSQSFDKESVSDGTAIMDEKEYCQYYDAVFAFVGKITKNGVSGLKLGRKFNRMARQQGWQERAFWGFHKKKMLPRIKEMLGKDIPVILCIPMALFQKDKDKKLSFYRKNGQGEYVQSTSTNGHYVVVTALFYEKGEPYLVISSWGRQYFIKWREYQAMVCTQFLGGFLGNLLYIR